MQPSHNPSHSGTYLCMCYIYRDRSELTHSSHWALKPGLVLIMTQQTIELNRKDAIIQWNDNNRLHRRPVRRNVRNGCWTLMTKLNPSEPKEKALPHVWRYNSIRLFLLPAGKLVTEKQAERRELMSQIPLCRTPIGDARSAAKIS